MVKQEEMELAIVSLYESLTNNDSTGWDDNEGILNLQLISKYYEDKAITSRSRERTQEYSVLTASINQLVEFLQERNTQVRREQSRKNKAKKSKDGITVTQAVIEF